jgi:parvulin-like peptidyl-prolyl isomerase
MRLASFALLGSLFAASNLCAAEANDVLVSEGAFKVTVQDVDTYVNRVPPPDRPGFMSNPDRVNQIILEILRTKKLAAQSVELKLDQNPAIQRQISMAADEVRARARIEAFMAQQKIPDVAELAKEEYVAHKAAYTKPAVVDVQHVLITSGAERSDDQAKAIAEDVRKRAVANPSGFDALVAQYSDDKKSQNGIIHDATRPIFAAQFREAAEAMHKKDEISPVVKTKFGYHVIRVLDYTPPVIQEFDKVKGGLMQKLETDFQNKKKADFVTGLISDKLEVNAPLVQEMTSRFQSPSAQNPQTASDSGAQVKQ